MSTATLDAPEAAIETDITPSYKSYVITGDLVGGGREGISFKKGQVVPEHMFQPGTNFDRLILCTPSAIRPAMPHEVPGTFVDASNTNKPGKSLTTQLNEANETVARLTSLLTTKDREIETLKKAKSDMYDPERDNILEADRKKLTNAILTLEGQLKAEKALTEDLRKKLNTKR